MSGTVFSCLGKGEGLSEEQKRLWQQVEVCQADITLNPGGQLSKFSYHGVDKKTGETIHYRDFEKRKDDLLRDEKGRRLTPDEYLATKEGWGRTIHKQPKEGALALNANIGIRTNGKDALDIVLVETTKNPPLGYEDKYGEKHEMGDTRRWEYQISRKGVDKSKAENVLKVPVYNNVGEGLLADIGNTGSTYTSKDLTTKNFKPQKVMRRADDIEIVFPAPTTYGVALFVLERDAFEMFADKKAYRGGSIVIPEGSVDHVRGGYRNMHIQLKGNGDGWGEILYSAPESARSAEDKKALEGTIYEKPVLAQDEIIFKERSGDGKDKIIERLSAPAIDAEAMVPEGATISVASNTGYGASVSFNGKSLKIPPTNGGNSGLSAWECPPAWLHGPGPKGTTDLSGLDGRIVLSGGGTVKLSQKPIQNWWYTDLILTGGSKEKSVYTIEIPEFDDPKLKLDLIKENPRKFKLDRYPMPGVSTLPLTYPDGSTVNKMQTENDTIYIRGKNIEVHIKQGDKTRVLYDSDDPQYNKQSSTEKPKGTGIGAATVLALAAGAEGEAITSRRGFLSATAALAASTLPGGSDSQEKRESILHVEESRIKAPDPATASVTTLMPDIRIGGNGKIAMLTNPAMQGKSPAVGG
jgi:hypothetical protein